MVQIVQLSFLFIAVLMIFCELSNKFSDHWLLVLSRGFIIISSFVLSYYATWLNLAPVATQFYSAMLCLAGVYIIAHRVHKYGIKQDANKNILYRFKKIPFQERV